MKNKTLVRMPINEFSIMFDIESWEELDKLFRTRKNKLNTKFRLLAPLN